MQWFDTWARRCALVLICSFQFFIGARRIGKTFSYLEGYVDAFRAGEVGKLIYIRLTRREFEEMQKPDENPFNEINAKRGWCIQLNPNGDDCLSIYDAQNDVEIGIVRPLASFKNLRGVSFAEYTDIYFDEFLPTEHVRKTAEIKKAGFLFTQAYETINSNRELLGAPAVCVVFTANSFTLDSSILAEFGLQKVIEHMQRVGQKKHTDRESGVYIELCEAREVSEAKKTTALYRALGARSDIKRVNIENKFDGNSINQIAKIRYNEYIPIISISYRNTNFTIYEHKSEQKYFVNDRLETAKVKITHENIGVFLNSYYSLIVANMKDNRVKYNNADTYFYFTSFLEAIKTKPW